MSNQISIVYMHSNINPDINPILLLYLLIFIFMEKLAVPLTRGSAVGTGM